MSQTQVRSDEDLRQVLERLSIRSGPVFIKVNWTSPLEGMYTERQVLEQFLEVLPRPVVFVEAHSVGRLAGKTNLADLPIEMDEYQRIIRAADKAFLKETGLDTLMEAPSVSYFNITEAVWKGQCVPGHVIQSDLKSAGEGPLKFPEFYDYVPTWLYEQRHKASFLNLTRVKVPAEDHGDWSLTLKNLFGLIPDPYRIKYHRQDLPGAIIDINRIYRTLFPVVDIAEALHWVVIYDEEGDRRVPWGRYRLLPGNGTIFWGHDPVALDLEVGRRYGRNLSKRQLILRAQAMFTDEG